MERDAASEQSTTPGLVHVPLPPDVSAAARARSAARETAGGWRLPRVVEPLQLVVSELVANAVRHGRPPVQMWLRRAGRGVRVDVRDESPVAAPGRVTLSGPDAESGRGLYLVDAVSTETGVEQVPGDGKVTWARVDPD